MFSSPIGTGDCKRIQERKYLVLIIVRNLIQRWMPQVACWKNLMAELWSCLRKHSIVTTLVSHLFDRGPDARCKSALTPAIAGGPMCPHDGRQQTWRIQESWQHNTYHLWLGRKKSERILKWKWTFSSEDIHWTLSKSDVNSGLLQSDGQCIIWEVWYANDYSSPLTSKSSIECEESCVKGEFLKP